MTNVEEIERIVGEEPAGNLLQKVSMGSKDDIHQAAVNLRSIARARGMNVGLCDDISSGAPMTDAEGLALNPSIFGWTGEGRQWWKDLRLALHSPMPTACRYQSEPFWGNANGFHGRHLDPHLADIDVTHFFSGRLKNYAILMVPIHLPFGQISANSFNPVSLDISDLSREFELYSEFFSLIVRRFITDYVGLMAKPVKTLSDCSLTKREVECLRWAAVGKTDKEISTIVQISRSTVRFHLIRASENLGTSNRAQTIFKAGQLGYLGTNQ